MTDFLRARRQVLDAVVRELVGPDPCGAALDCSVELRFPDEASAAGPFVQAASGDEILQFDRPVKRYGIGVLYPPETPGDLDPADLPGPAPTGQALAVEVAAESEDASPLTQAASDQIDRLIDQLDRIPEAEPDDFDLGSANAYRPSSMAVTFLGRIPKNAHLVIEASGGRYVRRTGVAGKRSFTWWLRQPVSLIARIAGADLKVSASRLLVPHDIQIEGAEGLNLRCEIYARPETGGAQLLTVCLINRSKADGSFDEHCLFQAAFTARVESHDSAAAILPYPGLPTERLDSEELSIELLYRDVQTFAVGHGCAADWVSQPGSQVATGVSACPLPVYETPSITPDIQRADNTLMQFSMAKLAGLEGDQDGLAEIEELITLYSGWIADRTQEVTALPEHFRGVATGHLDECIRAVSRMKTGLKLVRTDQHVRLAFQLANRSILLQQIRARREPRSIIYDAKAHRFGFSEAAPSSDIQRAPEGKGYWRPFQIAFLLSTLESVANPRSLDRNTVDLIWFPTGGGKTEAYLGLAAFSMFHRRLTKSGDRGVDVLMRYTLRLLTAQQFERAGAVICAMEHIRLTVKLPRANDLGLAPFSIGIWLGGTTTPNRRDEARSLLHQLERGDRDADNKFLLLKCPWCSAQIGPLPQARGEGSDRRHKAPRVIGYAEEGGTVVLRCSDSNCDFSEGLPIYVIDEDIYEYRPSMVIGTVDKFAMLAWRPEARSLFGIEPTGQRSSHPPGLIVQDELHLISGPLGSMVGLYEGVIEYLCTDPDGVKPKLVSSTATIRRFREQVGSLYCREDVALFPPRGLNANDSFFATYAKLQDSTLAPGRMYVGIHAPGLGSLQTAQVRTFAALLQAAGSMTKAEADPWWTLVMFFNSLRELGVTLSLFQSDIRDYLNVLRKRYGLGFGDVRKLRKVIELTGRLRSSEVPESIAALEIPATSQQYPVDACLASNIIEVGIDIDRLSLMAVVGQPKTTAQYIQVTGRVGRRWWERPGLVTTIYSASKPRDRSHFEKFRSYHERLYAGVEPTSVTPFSPAVLDRALHAVMATYVRQIGDPKVANRPYPIPERLVNEVSAVLRNRVKAVDPEEVASLEGMLARRLDEWRRWQRTRWDGRQQDDDIPLLREAGAYASARRSRLSWPTPQSMRNVDAECQAEVTDLYLLQDGDV